MLDLATIAASPAEGAASAVPMAARAPSRGRGRVGDMWGQH